MGGTDASRAGRHEDEQKEHVRQEDRQVEPVL